tara:strand:- start:412 stop:540 length:129 start_codon:yes stop_codon:yes gene_type:complete
MEALGVSDSSDTKNIEGTKSTSPVVRVRVTVRDRVRVSTQRS